jgi:beta propeller repeat protein
VAYNLLSGEQITHPVATYPYHPYPRIYENLVVWGDIRQGDDNGDIYGYDLDAHQEFAVITNTASQYAPVIDQNFVVYEQEVTGTTSAVYVYDLLTGESSFIYEENDTTQGGAAFVYDVTVHAGLIGFYEAYVSAPNIIYVARQLPERVYMPIFRKAN